MPVYNRANAVAGAVESVLRQTFQDFELVIVDDGSSDALEEALRPYLSERVRLVRQSNAGGSAARNRGIDEARGAFIAFLDSDDFFLECHLANMKALLDGTHNTVAYSQVIVDRGSERRFVKPHRAIRADEPMAEYLMCDRGFVQTSGLVVPAAVAREVRYRVGLPYGQDTDFAIRLQLAGCAFVMAAEPAVIWSDDFDPKRVSSSRKGQKVVGWLDEMRPYISERAYLGYRGWHVAKGVFVTNPLKAVYYYSTALWKGCYRPKLALTVLLQIVLPVAVYRRVADAVIGTFRNPL